MQQNSKNNNADSTGKFVASSGNIFADLGLPEADELLVKADLMHAITREIRQRGLTQTQAAEMTGLNQADISRVSAGKMEKFSQERLINALRRIGVDIEIVVHGEHTGSGRIVVRELV